MTRVSSGPFRNSDPWLASKILRGDFGTYKLSWYPPFLCRFYTPDNSTAPLSHIVVLGFIRIFLAGHIQCLTHPRFILTLTSPRGWLAKKYLIFSAHAIRRKRLGLVVGSRLPRPQTYLRSGVLREVCNNNARYSNAQYNL